MESTDPLVGPSQVQLGSQQPHRSPLLPLPLMSLSGLRAKGSSQDRLCFMTEMKHFILKEAMTTASHSAKHRQGTLCKEMEILSGETAAYPAGTQPWLDSTEVPHEAAIELTCVWAQ